jgi:hypothetical protein
MLLRALIIVSSLLLSFTAVAKDMSNWSDKTLCRLQETLSNDDSYHQEIRSRGLICPALGSKQSPYRKAYFQSTSALCEKSTQAQQSVDELAPAPNLDLLDHVAMPSTIISHSPPGQLMLVHDFNLDGMDDLLVNTGIKEPHLHLLSGHKSGQFIDQPLANAKAANGQISRIQIVEFNQDEWADFIVYTLDGHNQVFINQQGQGFKAMLLAAHDVLNNSAGGDLADLNGDGIAELLVASYQGHSPKAPLIGASNYAFTASDSPYSPLINQHLGQDLGAGDLNGDGLVDLVISLSNNPSTNLAADATKHLPLQGNLTIIYGDGDLNFENNQHAFMGSAKDLGGPVKLLDVNGDQKLDIVHAYSRQVNADTLISGLTIYLNHQVQPTCFVDVSAHLLPELYLQPWIHANSEMGVHPIRDIQISDADQDGKLDLWVQFQADIANSGLLLQQDNQFRVADLQANSVSSDKMLTGDFNGDGLNDIAKLVNHQASIEIQPWLHTSKIVAPFAPYKPDNFANISAEQRDIIQAFVDDKFIQPLPWQQLFEGQAEGAHGSMPVAWQGDYLLAWYWLPSDAEQVDFLGMDNIHLNAQGLQLTTKSLYQFHPTRAFREQLQFHSNRQLQFILRGKLDTQAGQPAQATELFGNLANRAALGVLEDGSIVLMELLKP